MRKLGFVFLLAGSAIVLAQTPPAPASPQIDPPPDFPPSYQVHISPTAMTTDGTATSGDRNYWIARGWDLKSMIAEAWHVDESRLDIAPSVAADKRYDFAMVLPQAEDRDTIYGYTRQAIQDQFHLHIALERQPKDVYVLTTPNGLSAAVKILPKITNGVWTTGLSMTDNSLSAQSTTMERLSHVLERRLGRLVVDESKIPDRFDVEVQGQGRGKDALLTMLRDKVGLVLTADHREVEMLVVRGQ